MWNLQTNQQQQVAQHAAAVRHCFYVRQLNMLVTGSWDKTVKYWDLRSPTPAHTQQMPERVYAMDVQSELLVVGTADRQIQVGQGGMGQGAGAGAVIEGPGCSPCTVCLVPLLWGFPLPDFPACRPLTTALPPPRPRLAAGLQPEQPRRGLQVAAVAAQVPDALHRRLPRQVGLPAGQHRGAGGGAPRRGRDAVQELHVQVPQVRRGVG